MDFDRTVYANTDTAEPTRSVSLSVIVENILYMPPPGGNRPLTRKFAQNCYNYYQS